MNKILILIVVSVLATACATGGSSSGGTGSGTATDAATTAETATGGETAAATDTGATPADAAPADSTGADSTGADTTGGGADTPVGVDAIVPADTASSGATFAAALPGLKAKCATCHNPNAKLFFQAENCASCATKAATMKFQITTGKMPQSGMPKLADDERAAILAWIDGGAKCP